MDAGSIAVRALGVIVVLYILMVAGAIIIPYTAIILGAGGLVTLLLLLLAIIVFTIIGSLIGNGIRGQKQRFAALLLAFIGALFLGASLVVFSILNAPFAPHVNLIWLGRAWYSQLITLFLIGAPLMLVFVV